MPELPDVEAQRRVAARHALGRTVRSTRCRDRQVLRNTTPQGFGRALADATLTAAERHGKWLCLATDSRSDVLLHFGMTGALHRHDAESDVCDRDLLMIVLDDGVLAYHVTRKLGGVWLVRGGRERQEVTGTLGVDALDLDVHALREAIAGSRAALKAALMDQERVAGLGNLLVDEVCWQAGLHPGVPASQVPDEAWPRLADAIDRVLAAGMEVGHVPDGDGFLTGARDDEDPRCPRCGAPLARGTIAGRTSRWCQKEQAR